MSDVVDLFGNPVAQPSQGKRPRKTAEQKAENIPEKLGKAIRLPVSDFSDPETPAIYNCFNVNDSSIFARRDQ